MSCWMNINCREVAFIFLYDHISSFHCSSTSFDVQKCLPSKWKLKLHTSWWYHILVLNITFPNNWWLRKPSFSLLNSHVDFSMSILFNNHTWVFLKQMFILYCTESKINCDQPLPKISIFHFIVQVFNIAIRHKTLKIVWCQNIFAATRKYWKISWNNNLPN